MISDKARLSGTTFHLLTDNTVSNLCNSMLNSKDRTFRHQWKLFGLDKA